MEASQPLSIESFSYSWLINLKPSFESLDDSLRTSLDVSDEASFIEMDPRMPPSKRFFRNSQDFNFDFPISQPPLSLVHADELFSNGLIMPIFMEPLKMEAYDGSYSLPATPISSSHAPKHVLSATNTRCSSLRRCRRLSKQILQKYLDFLRPLYRRIRGRRIGSRAESVNSRMQEGKSWVYSPEASPRTSTAYSTGDWRKSCDSESSIYEAVLHCKRSIGGAYREHHARTQKVSLTKMTSISFNVVSDSVSLLVTVSSSRVFPSSFPYFTKPTVPFILGPNGQWSCSSEHFSWLNCSQGMVKRIWLRPRSLSHVTKQDRETWTNCARRNAKAQ
ncbi:putative membrane-associated kinase regulator 6 [Vitis vinifera]|uniref:Putative membrane-associated kinase regulator 6 n=1 Tax=Vitis vinifera TaxID=29760 RepID=A0A438DP59_VITVI|nr:putative membrane-associated kinase regulator 6 [Vitis vinifera]